RGDFTVSVAEVDDSQLPPLPVNNVRIERQADSSILVSWDDPNSPDLVDSYDIYRCGGGFVIMYDKVATVSDTSWVDTSGDIQTDFIGDTSISYYVVVRARNGKESPQSQTAGFY
ncbi:MAG: hypothetical protein ACM3MK_04925, partial [Chitinophagales bacterium]